MKIIIAGNGKTGYHLAGQLSAEGHDVIVLDHNPLPEQINIPEPFRIRRKYLFQ